MIACIVLPYFAAAVERRHSVDLGRQPLVIGGRPWEPRPVYAFSREVAQRGVAPGMSLRLAHVLSPQARFLPATSPRYFGASGEMVDVLTDFTHLIEPEDLWQPFAGGREQQTAGGRCLPARYYLDLEKLPFPEALSLAREMGRTIRRQTHLAPALGLAPNKFAAQVAATLARPNHLRPVPAEEATSFLATCTVHFLPLDRETRRRLRLLGIRTLGDLAALPVAALQAQFGAALVPYYQLAGDFLELGGGPAVRPAPPEKELQVTFRFDGPVADSLSLGAALGRLATMLAGRLQAAGREGGSLRLGVTGDNGCQPPPDFRLTLRRPTAEPRALALALDELLRQASLSGPVTALTVTAGQLAPATAVQLSLFAPAGNKAAITPPALIRIVSRYGSPCLYQATLADRRHPLPERRFQLREWAPL
jgi:nucleotidyltransferase/DNA polymerase involved in DNA repair